MREVSAENPVNPNRALWEKGDFTRIARTMRKSGEALTNSFGITKGLKILDLGCGDGTTALPAAALGADVLGVDIARNLVEGGNRRAREQGLSNCRFQEGDASAAPLRSGQGDGAGNAARRPHYHGQLDSE